jgi:hypothetical protein
LAKVAPALTTTRDEVVIKRDGSAVVVRGFCAMADDARRVAAMVRVSDNRITTAFL